MTITLDEFLTEQRHLNERRRRLHPLLRFLTSLVAKVEVEGVENVPQSGPTLLIGNHISLLDPTFFTVAVRNRYVVSMAKVETLDSAWQAWALRTWGNFVVNRDEIDRTALKQAIGLIEDEQLVWIAPEGTRNPDGMSEAKSGVAYIAHKANAIVVPSVVCGAQDWQQRWRRLRRAYCKVIFGKPFRFRVPEGERLSREVREQMIQEAMYQLALTMPDAYAHQRGLYSDVENATTKYLDFV